MPTCTPPGSAISRAAQTPPGEPCEGSHPRSVLRSPSWRTWQRRSRLAAPLLRARSGPRHDEPRKRRWGRVRRNIRQGPASPPRKPPNSAASVASWSDLKATSGSCSRLGAGGISVPGGLTSATEAPSPCCQTSGHESIEAAGRSRPLVPQLDRHRHARIGRPKPWGSLGLVVRLRHRQAGVVFGDERDLVQRRHRLADDAHGRCVRPATFF